MHNCGSRVRACTWTLKETLKSRQPKNQRGGGGPTPLSTSLQILGLWEGRLSTPVRMRMVQEEEVDLAQAGT